MLLAGLVAGCYTYQPIVTAPEPGSTLALDLNDQGRVGMRTAIGPEIARVEGALVGASDTTYELRVAETLGLSGTRSRWSGEAVSMRREYVGVVTEKRLSRQRTFAAVLGGVAAAMAFVMTRDLFGLGGDSGSSVPGGGGGDDQ
ncbi:MAG: hypothetical protein ACREMR_11595 [Gemmatimonadales bacterium]